jgi:hypothetical protein
MMGTWRQVTPDRDELVNLYLHMLNESNPLIKKSCNQIYRETTKNFERPATMHC